MIVYSAKIAVYILMSVFFRFSVCTGGGTMQEQPVPPNRPTAGPRLLLCSELLLLSWCLPSRYISQSLSESITTTTSDLTDHVETVYNFCLFVCV